MKNPEAGKFEHDAKLVTAVLADDEAAFGQLYDRYARLVRAMCFDATQDQNQTQDLCQETFLRAYRELPGLREPEKFCGWITGIARFVCREWKRGKARDRHRYVGLELRVDEVGAPCPAAEDDELVQLRRALSGLPADQRLALHLFYLQEQSSDHARAVLNLSRPGFYKLLRRARRRLAKHLGSSWEVQQWNV